MASPPENYEVEEHAQIQNTGQILAEPPEEPKAKPPRVVSIAGGQVRLDLEKWPLVGRPDAQRVFVEMSDYTCPYCRANHQSVKGALDRLGPRAAVVVLSVPMNATCNDTVQETRPAHRDACELARLSVAVWRVRPEKFALFHEWLFSGGQAPRAAAAKAKAEQLVGKQALAEELSRDIAAKYVARHVDIYRMIGAGTIPKLLFPGTTISGQVSSVDSLLEIIERQAVAQQ
jgi:protein-disulfide isomerase